MKRPNALTVDFKAIDAMFVAAAKQINHIRQLAWEQFYSFWQKWAKNLAVSSFLLPEIINYCGWGEDLKESLRDSFRLDCKLGYTSCGPHRADLRFFVATKAESKDVLSRGQGKFVAISLLAARAMFLQQINNVASGRGGSSIILIDDLDSELDNENSKKLFQVLAAEERVQLIVTGVRKEGLATMAGNQGKWFEVRDGHVFHVEH